MQDLVLSPTKVSPHVNLRNDVWIVFRDIKSPSGLEFITFVFILT